MDTTSFDFNPFLEDSSAFRVIFQSANEGILVSDKSGKILMTNPVGERMFGYEASELTGMRIEELVPAKYRSIHTHYRHVYHQAPKSRKMGAGRDLIGQKKDGTIFPLEASLSTVALNGEMYVVAFIVDISERKNIEDALSRSEEQLVTYAAELEQRVKQRTEDLDRTILQLEKEVSDRKRAERQAVLALEKEQSLNELKSRFVSMASHEFRTPLSTILSSVSLIEKYRERGDLDKIDKHIDRVKGSVKNLVSILDDFLSLSRLEEGKVNLDKCDVDLAVVVSDFLEEISPLRKPGQHFVFPKGNPVPTYTDPRLFKNILTNLTSNAIKYSPENSPIHISLAAVQGTVTLQISDRGMGIPEEDQQHLFERFFRAKNAINIQGTGLGLNIVKRYVDLLDGKITFESKPSQGTIFTVTIPQNPS